MTTFEACRSDVLIVTLGESTGGAGAALDRVMGNTIHPLDPRTMPVKGPGDALRLIHRHDPRLLLVCVERANLMQSAALMDAVHRRRPGLALIALAPLHDESVERAVRAAGAAYYFALDSQADHDLLRSALGKLGVARESVRSGLSPPRPCAPRRRRGGRSSFS